MVKPTKAQNLVSNFDKQKILVTFDAEHSLNHC